MGSLELLIDCTTLQLQDRLHLQGNVKRNPPLVLRAAAASSRLCLRARKGHHVEEAHRRRRQVELLVVMCTSIWTAIYGPSYQVRAASSGIGR